MALSLTGLSALATVSGAYQQRLYSVSSQNLIAYWPLDESGGTTAYDKSGNGLNATYLGTTQAATPTPVGTLAPQFDGDDAINIYSSGLESAFNGSEGSMLQWFKILNASIWTDATERWSYRVWVSDANQVLIRKSSTDNQIITIYFAGGVSSGVAYDTSRLDFFSMLITWSKSNDRFRQYINGSQNGSDVTGLGNWAGGPLGQSACVIGAGNTLAAAPSKGYCAHCALWDVELSPAQALAVGKT